MNTSTSADTFKLKLKWVKESEESWLTSQYRGNIATVQSSEISRKIESLAEETNKVGPQPLWDGYERHNRRGPSRTPSKVRTSSALGNFYLNLVTAFKPGTIVEFGTAFGVSGMYFLAGIKNNKKGHLYTFEPNNIWRTQAVKCLDEIDHQYTSVCGTFEDNIDNTLRASQSIDLAFIDAIHTKEFVLPQLELVIQRCGAHSIIILDDINFSDSMKECWAEVSAQDRFASALEVGSRAGLLELRR